jgi:hypothetical protein
MAQLPSQVMGQQTQQEESDEFTPEQLQAQLEGLEYGAPVAPVAAPQPTMSMEYTPRSARFTGAQVGEPMVGGRSSVLEKYVVNPIGAVIGATGIEDLAMGINEALAYLPDAAINTVSRGIEAAGLAPEGSIDRDILLRIFNSGDYEAQRTIIPYIMGYGVGENIGTTEGLGTYGREAGKMMAMAAPFAGMTQRAASLTPKANIISKTGEDLTSIALNPNLGNRVREVMMAPYRTSPGAAAGTELGVAGISGIGIQAEQDLFGTQTGAGGLLPLAPAGLWYVAKNLPAPTMVRNAFNWVKGKVAPFTTSATEEAAFIRGEATAAEGVAGERALRGINQEIQSFSATEEGLQNLAQASQIETTFAPYMGEGESFLFSPAERLQSPNLITTETAAVQRGSAQFNQLNNQRKNRALGAAQNYINSNFSGTGIDDVPLYIIDQASGNYQTTINGIDAELNGITDSFSLWANARTGVYPEYGSPQVARTGQQIRAAIIEGHNQAKTDAQNLATKMGINETDEILDPTTFRASRMKMRSSFQNANGTESLDYAGLPSQVKAYIDNPNEMLSFQEWKGFRDQVSSAIGSAAAKGNKTDVRNLAILADELDDVAKNFGQVNDNFEQFRGWYNQNVIEPYERYGTIRVRSAGAGSTPESPVYLIPDEQVAQSFLENSNTVTEFVNLFGDDPRMMNNIGAMILDDVRNKTYSPSKGVFDPDKLNTYINQNAAKLEGLEIGGVPVIDQLRDTQRLIQQSVQRQAELTARRTAIEKNQLYQTLAKNGENPEKVLQSAIQNPSLMNELRTELTAGLSGAAKAQREKTLRRGVWEVVTRNQPDYAESPEKFIKFLDQNRRSLEVAFGQEHLDNLLLAGETFRRLQTTGQLNRGAQITPETLVGEGGAIEAATGTSLRSLSTLARATAEGRISGLSALTYVLSRAVGKASSLRTDTLLREMIFDPEISALLTGTPKGGVTEMLPATKRRLNAWLFANGINYSMEDLLPTGEGERPVSFDLPVTGQGVPTSPAPGMDPNQLRMQGLPRQPDPNAVDASRLPPNRTAPAPAATPAPAAAPPQAATQTPTASELFPFDPTLSAIERRRGQPQGIASLA